MIQFMKIGAAFLYMVLIFVTSAILGMIISYIDTANGTKHGVSWVSAGYFITLLIAATAFYMFINQYYILNGVFYD